MPDKRFSCLIKFAASFVFVIVLLLLSAAVPIKAENEDKVRVSTAKELKQAIKQSDVKTIVFRTKAYLTFTIKSDKAAAGKELIIDAPNAVITNKAKFKSINIISGDYTEAVSGNSITISKWNVKFSVAKKKNVKELSFKDSLDFVDVTKIVVKKGAKIKKVIPWIIDDGSVDFSYNSKKRTWTYSIGESDLSSYKRTLTYKFDKSGRLISYVRKTEDIPSGYIIIEKNNYKYNSDGYMIRFTSDSDDEHSESEYVYDSKNRLIKNVNKADGKTKEIIYSYDSKGRLIHEESRNADDAEDFMIVDYKYDKEGRNTEQIYKDSTGELTVSEIIDSKGFAVETGWSFEGEYAPQYSIFNDKGDLIRVYKPVRLHVSYEDYYYDIFGDRLYTVYGDTEESELKKPGSRIVNFVNDRFGKSELVDIKILDEKNNIIAGTFKYPDAGFTFTVSNSEVSGNDDLQYFCDDIYSDFLIKYYSWKNEQIKDTLEFFGIKSYNSIDENNCSDARCFSIYESKLITTSEKVKDDINLVCNMVADYSSSNSSIPKILNNYSVKVYLSDTGEYLGEKSKFSLSLDELRSLL